MQNHSSRLKTVHDDSMFCKKETTTLYKPFPKQEALPILYSNSSTYVTLFLDKDIVFIVIHEVQVSTFAYARAYLKTGITKD
jgi:hypothetical protein